MLPGMLYISSICPSSDHHKHRHEQRLEDNLTKPSPGFHRLVVDRLEISHPWGFRRSEDLWISPWETEASNSELPRGLSLSEYNSMSLASPCRLGPSLLSQSVAWQRGAAVRGAVLRTARLEEARQPMTPRIFELNKGACLTHQLGVFASMTGSLWSACRLSIYTPEASNPVIGPWTICWQAPHSF